MNIAELADPCNKKRRKEKFKELEEEQEEKFMEIIWDLIKEYGLFFLTLLGSQLAAAGLDFMGAALSVLLGSVVGGVMSLLAMGLAAINGLEIVCMYLVAKNLNSKLDSRINLGRNLLIDVNLFLDLIREFERGLEADTNKAKDLGFLAAYKKVKEAAFIVGKEATKVKSKSTFKGSVDSRVLEKAQIIIEGAVEDLVGSGIDVNLFSKEVRRLNKRYNIEQSDNLNKSKKIGISIPRLNPKKMAEEAVDNIIKTYKENYPEIIRRYILDFIALPGINDTFRSIVAVVLIYPQVANLGNHLPILSIKVSLMAHKKLYKMSVKAEKKIEKKVGKEIPYLDEARKIQNDIPGEVNSVFDYLNLSIDNSKKANYSSSKITMGGVSMGINLVRLAVLRMESVMGVIRLESGLLKMFLLPASDRLDEVKKSMSLYKKHPNEKGIPFKLKMNWIGELNVAKGYLDGAIGRRVSLSGGDGDVTNEESKPEDIRNAQELAFEQWANLQEYITSRTVEEGSDGIPQEIETEDEKISNISERYLGSLFTDFGFLFDSNKRKEVKKGLQSLKMLLETQKEKDTKERSLCSTFMSTAQSSEMFQFYYDSYMSLINSLKDVDYLNDAIKGLENGDASAIANALSEGAYVIDQLFMGCDEPDEEKESDEEKELLAINLGIGFSDAEEEQKATDFAIDLMNKDSYLMKVIEKSMTGQEGLE